MQETPTVGIPEMYESELDSKQFLNWEINLRTGTGCRAFSKDVLPPPRPI